MTIVILAIVSALLLTRAYYIRRRFQRRIEEAIAAGQPLPQDAAIALGLVRPGADKGKKEVGPMPAIWDARMEKEDREQFEEEKGWDTLEVGHRFMIRSHPAIPLVSQTWPLPHAQPVALIHFPPPLPEALPEKLVFPPAPHERLLQFFRDPRPFLPSATDFVPRRFRPAAPPEAGLARAITRIFIKPQIVHDAPEVGEECVVGVLIALPVQPGDERWSGLGAKGDDGEEQEERVPEVCLGVTECTIRE